MRRFPAGWRPLRWRGGGPGYACPVAAGAGGAARPHCFQGERAGPGGGGLVRRAGWRGPRTAAAGPWCAAARPPCHGAVPVPGSVRGSRPAALAPSSPARRGPPTGPYHGEDRRRRRLVAHQQLPGGRAPAGSASGRRAGGGCRDSAGVRTTPRGGAIRWSVIRRPSRPADERQGHPALHDAEALAHAVIRCTETCLPRIWKPPGIHHLDRRSHVRHVRRGYTRTRRGVPQAVRPRRTATPGHLGGGERAVRRADVRGPPSGTGRCRRAPVRVATSWTGAWRAGWPAGRQGRTVRGRRAGPPGVPCATRRRPGVVGRPGPGWPARAGTPRTPR